MTARGRALGRTPTQPQAPRRHPTLWYACPSPAFSAPPVYPVLAVNSSPRSNKYLTGEHYSSEPRGLSDSGADPGGASSGGNVQLPCDPPLKRRQLYLLKFEPQTEMFSLRTIKATSNGLFLETEIPLKERDRVYRPAACGWHVGSGIALRSPGPPRRPWARCESGGPRAREAAPRGGLSTAAEAGPGYPDPHASPQTPKHSSHNSKPRLCPRSGKGHLSEPVLYRPGPPRGSGVRGGGSPSTWAAPPPEGRSRARCDPGSASPRAGLDGSHGRAGGPVRKQRCRAREDGYSVVSNPGQRPGRQGTRGPSCSVSHHPRPQRRPHARVQPRRAAWRVLLLRPEEEGGRWDRRP